MGVMVDVLWSQAEVRRVLVVALLGAVAVAVWSSRRRGSWIAASGLTLAIGVVLAVSLSSVFLNPGPGFAWWSQCRLEGPAELARELRTHQGLANVFLFVPVGLFAAALHGRVRAGLAVGVVLSLAVEVVQGATWGRDCSSVDVVANVVGAAVGAAIVGVTLAAWTRRAAVSGPPPAPHQP